MFLHNLNHTNEPFWESSHFPGAWESGAWEHSDDTMCHGSWICLFLFWHCLSVLLHGAVRSTRSALPYQTLCCRTLSTYKCFANLDLTVYVHTLRTRFIHSLSCTRQKPFLFTLSTVYLSYFSRTVRDHPSEHYKLKWILHSWWDRCTRESLRGEFSVQVPRNRLPADFLSLREQLSTRIS